MYIHTQDDDRISLTIKEIALLITLNQGPSSGYYLAKITQLGQSTVYLALKRLKLGRLINVVEDRTDPTLNPGKARIVYQITSIGELILEQHITMLEQLIRTAKG